MSSLKALAFIRRIFTLSAVVDDKLKTEMKERVIELVSKFYCTTRRIQNVLVVFSECPVLHTVRIHKVSWIIHKLRHRKFRVIFYVGVFLKLKFN